MAASKGSRLVAIASRERSRAQQLAARHGIEAVEPDYEGVLGNPGVEAVYIPLVNSLHREWTLKALGAGKHVLCEKPLAIDSAQGAEMAEAARNSNRLLMEAFMYRFHPRMGQLKEAVGEPDLLQAAFGFPLRDQANYRLRPELGGGALMDVGCYVLDVARWLMGEPEQLSAVATTGDVDLAVGITLAYPGHRLASLWASMASPEHQELLLLDHGLVHRVAEPFTAWKDPHDPYQLMVEAFTGAVLESGRSPLPVEESLATLRLIDRVREAAGIPVPGVGEAL